MFQPHSLASFAWPHAVPFQSKVFGGADVRADGQELPPLGIEDQAVAGLEVAGAGCAR